VLVEKDGYLSSLLHQYWVGCPILIADRGYRSDDGTFCGEALINWG
jgi:hypothetical protein